MTWGAIGGAAVSVVGGYVMNKNKGGSSNPVQTSDPFADQRAQYQPMLQNLMNSGQPQLSSAAMIAPGATFNPNDPSYQFRLQQGSENMQRQLAASGLGSSGNAMAALQDYGQQAASQEFGNEFARASQVDQLQQGNYNNRYSQLAQLSGATSGNPAAAGALQANQQAGASAALTGLTPSLVNAGGSLWNMAMGGGGSNITIGDGSSSVGAISASPMAVPQLPNLYD